MTGRPVHFERAVSLVAKHRVLVVAGCFVSGQVEINAAVPVKIPPGRGVGLGYGGGRQVRGLVRKRKPAHVSIQFEISGTEDIRESVVVVVPRAADAAQIGALVCELGAAVSSGPGWRKTFWSPHVLPPSRETRVTRSEGASSPAPSSRPLL